MISYSKREISLKNKLLIYFILVTLISTSIISMYYYSRTKNVVVKNIGDNNFKVISHVMNNIDKQVEQADNLADSIFVNTDIVNLLSRPAASANIYDQTKVRAIESIAKQFQYMNITKDLLSLFVIGENGLDLRSGSEASLIDPDDFYLSEWFLEAKKQNSKIQWGNTQENYTKISNYKKVIPQARAIKNLSTDKILGYSVMLFNTSIFSDCYKDVLLNKGERIYLTDALGNIISTNQDSTSEKNIAYKEYFKKLLKGEEEQYFEAEVDGDLSLIIYKRSPNTHWTLIEVVPMTQVEEQKVAIERTAMVFFFAVFLMCILLSNYLSDNFTRPIKTIVNQVNEISQGNFEQSISLNASSEIRNLSNSITKMKGDIKNLLEESIEKEKEKRTAEIKMLQSQINPHFLYNTLNSIKLMATLQGARGIENMIGSLGRILKVALSGVNNKITLKEELNILDDYMNIQRIRYKGKIQFTKNISEERLLNCAIIKLILQPIIENTIQHGIAPKEESGDVILTIYDKGGNLVIEILDNGIGISQEKLVQLKASMEETRGINIDGAIGLKNTNHRIKLVYGDEYELKFDSRFGEYTKVTLMIPIEYMGNDSERR